MTKGQFRRIGILQLLARVGFKAETVKFVQMNWSRTSAFVNQIDSENELIHVEVTKWRCHKMALRQRKPREQSSLPRSTAEVWESVAVNVFGLFTSVYSLVSDQFHIVECSENSCLQLIVENFQMHDAAYIRCISAFHVIFQAAEIEKGKRLETDGSGKVNVHFRIILYLIVHDV